MGHFWETKWLVGSGRVSMASWNLGTTLCLYISPKTVVSRTFVSYAECKIGTPLNGPREN